MQICEKCGGEIQGFYHNCRPDGKSVRVSDSSLSTGCVLWRDLEVGEKIEVGDRMIHDNCSEWVEVTERHISLITHYQRGLKPVQRKAHNSIIYGKLSTYDAID